MSQKLVPSLDGRRIMAREVLIMTPSVRAAIKNGNTGEIYQMIQESGELGMVTMEQDLKHLVTMKRIAVDAAMSFANNKKRMQQLLGGGSLSL
jgi:twitching motility protein PilT